jgi:hypothetical protein
MDFITMIMTANATNYHYHHGKDPVKFFKIGITINYPYPQNPQNP